MREDLPNSPIHALFQIGNSIHHLNKLSERKLGLSLVQWILLQKLLDMPAYSPLALAAAVNIHPSTLTQTMKRLVRKGYIHVPDDPKDSRKKQVSLTRAGKDALDKATGQISIWAKGLQPLGQELKLLRHNLESQVESNL